MTALMTEAEAAAFLKCSRSFLRQARVKGDGPVFIYVSPRVVRYRGEDVSKWIDERAAASTLYPSRRAAAPVTTNGHSSGKGRGVPNG